MQHQNRYHNIFEIAKPSLEKPKISDFLLSFKLWYLSKVEDFTFLTSASNDILDELPLWLAASAKIKNTVHALFESIETTISCQNKDQMNFSIFHFQKSKKARNLKRVNYEIGDLQDYLLNFVEETNEFAKGYPDAEKKATKIILGYLNQDHRINFDAKIQTLLEKAARYQKTTAFLYKTFDINFIELFNDLENNLLKLKSNNPEQLSSRNSMELLIAFFNYCAKLVTSLRNLAAVSIQLIQIIWEFEKENAEYVKNALKIYTEHLNNFFTNSKVKMFEKTIEKVNALTMEPIVENIYSADNLLNDENLDYLKSKFETDKIETKMLAQYFTKITAEDYLEFFRFFELRSWTKIECLEKQSKIELSLKLSTEGMLVFVKFDSKTNEYVIWRSFLLEDTVCISKLEDDVLRLQIGKNGDNNNQKMTVIELSMEPSVKHELFGLINNGILKEKDRSEIATQQPQLISPKAKSDKSIFCNDVISLETIDEIHIVSNTTKESDNSFLQIN